MKTKFPTKEFKQFLTVFELVNLASYKPVWILAHRQKEES